MHITSYHYEPKTRFIPCQRRKPCFILGTVTQDYTFVYYEHKPRFPPTAHVSK